MAITIGNFFTTSTGQKVLGGAGGSGLDTQTLLTALVKARQDANITPLNDKVTLNDNKQAALAQLRTLVSNLQSASNQLRSVPGLNTASQNAFSYVAASVSSNSSVAGSSYVNVIAQPGSTLQSYTINRVTQLAAATKQTTGSFTIADANQSIVAASATAGQFTAGTVTIKGVPITLNAGDSLNQVAATFNNVAGQTGFSANVLQVASGQFKLVFTAAQSGTANAFDISSANTLAQVSDPSGVLTNTGIANTQTARDAQFTLDGVDLTRSSNSVSDAINGLTFTLNQTTPAGTTLNVAVTPDTSVAENRIIDFMNAYNDLKQFQANQNQVKSDGTYASTDYLVNDTVLNSTVQSIESTLSGIVPGIGSGQYNTLASVGIAFTNTTAVTDSSGKVTQAATSNVLTYDESKLKSALSSNFSQVAQLFQLSFKSDNTNLALYSGPAILPANALTVNVNPGTSTFQASYTDSSGAPKTVNLTAKLNTSGTGYSLTAPAGSALDGLVLLYNSTSAATVHTTVTQGVGDVIYKLSANVSKQNTGAIALEQSALQTSTLALQNQISLQTNLLNDYQTKLLAQFSALEQALAKANSLSSALSAQNDAALASRS